MVSSTKADDDETQGAKASEIEVFEHTYNSFCDELDDDAGVLDVRQFVHYMDGVGHKYRRAGVQHGGHQPCAGHIGTCGALLAACRVPALQQNPRHPELLHIWACDRYSDVAAHPVRFCVCESFCQGRWKHAVVPSWWRC
ncbi:hypothetical protein AYI70_g1226 [Smittium culicis]|uniref:Uncharacterized protein n=1 Tax=Smittium culicis TaxID=133412 RepID=A0A1R1YDH4_9FUNG|nr:hypothetical protein AYI70_g1226 [Smittium culicis]